MALNDVQIQESEALRIFARFHAIGFDEHDPFVRYEVAQIQSALRTEQEVNKNASFASLFTTSGKQKAHANCPLGIAYFSQWRSCPDTVTAL